MSARDPAVVRRALLPDLATLRRLEELSFDEPWSHRSLLAELENPGRRVLVVEVAPPDGGEAKVGGYACFLPSGEEVELLRLAIDPERRRRGLGRRLVEEGLRKLGEEGEERETREERARLCHLEVRADDVGAISFYRRLGFHSVGRRRAYYRDGADALLMSWKRG